MFDGASIFEQDLSSWDFTDKSVGDAFRGTQMHDPFYPLGCDTECGEVKYPFSDREELLTEIQQYMTLGQAAWAGLDCNGAECGVYYGYATLWT
jgi:hypothetical protein